MYEAKLRAVPCARMGVRRYYCDMPLPVETIHIRIPKEDMRWIESLARRNETTISSMVRLLLHGLRIAVEEDTLSALAMGELVLKP